MERGGGRYKPLSATLRRSYLLRPPEHTTNYHRVGAGGTANEATRTVLRVMTDVETPRMQYG